MTIQLDRALEERIRAKIRRGDYRNEDEVVAAALTLLDAHDSLSASELEQIGRALDAGLEDIAQERFVSLADVVVETDEVLDRHGG